MPNGETDTLLPAQVPTLGADDLVGFLALRVLAVQASACILQQRLLLLHLTQFCRPAEGYQRPIALTTDRQLAPWGPAIPPPRKYMHAIV